MGDPKVQLLKVSLIWFQTCDLLGKALGDAAGDGDAAGGGPLPELVDEVAFKRAFDQAKAQGGCGERELPWLPRSSSHFWERYLENVPDDINSHQAWRRIVPFRIRFTADQLFKIALAKPQVRDPHIRGPLIRLVAEGFLYRHGVAFVLTLNVETRDQSAPIHQVIDQLVKLRRTAQFGADDERVHDIDSLAFRALSALCKCATGKRLRDGGVKADPRSIVTAVRMLDVPKGDIVEHGGTHRILVALANLETNWRDQRGDSLGKLDEHKLKIKQSTKSPGRVLFATHAARVVWFPNLMISHPESPKKSHRLSCYHHNLTMATLQTEALMALIKEADVLTRRGRAGNNVQVARDCAAEHLGRLYDSQNCYRSSSVRAQINDDGEFKALINKACKLKNLRLLEDDEDERGLARSGSPHARRDAR